MQSKPFRKCALPQCAGLRFNLVHKFPRRKEKLQQWLQAIGCHRLSNTPQERLNLLWICCRHFRVDDYVNPQSKSLNVAAVPSLNLRSLDDLDKCRQGDIEKATVLTAEELEWIEEAKREKEKPFRGGAPCATSTPKTPTLNNTSPASIIAQVKEMKNRFSHMAPAHVLIQPPPPPTPSVPKTQNPPPSCLDEDSNSNSSDFTLLLEDGFIEINDFKLGRTFELNSIWLRSLCLCRVCYDAENSTPKINVFDLPPDTQPIMANVSEGTTKLEVVWDDGHTSTYDLNILYGRVQAQKLPQSSLARNIILWTSQHPLGAGNDDFQPLVCYDILMNADVIPTALRMLQRTGVLIIKALPRSDTDSVLRRTLIAKLFNHVWDNIVFEKRSQFCAAHKTPFTNCTFESMDKGLQMLTVPYHKENITVDLCLVDGFNAAFQLQQQHQVSYDFLRQYILDYAFHDKQGYTYKTRQPIIQGSKMVERIMFAPYQLADVRSQDFDVVASHTKKFNNILKLPENQWAVHLDTETLIILDNYRICWCIAKHERANELDCFYMERRHYIRSLQKLKE